MSLFVHFLWCLLFAGLWYGTGLLEDKLSGSPLMVLLYRGVRGGLMGMTICSFIAVVLGHVVGARAAGANNDSTGFIFTTFLVGLGMIGIPIGFLLGVARGQSTSSEDEAKPQQ